MMESNREPWIETREGGWFFVNALLVGPELVVLFPLLVGAVVTLLAPGRPPSPFLDTIPFVASKAIPWIGWLLVIPMGTTIKNLRMELSFWPRIGLVGMLLVHLSFLGYTIWTWFG